MKSGQTDPTPSVYEQVPARGFSTLRVLALAVPLLAVAAVLVQVTEINTPSQDTDLRTVLYPNQHPLAPIIPPALVVGLFVPVLMLSAAIPPLRRRWAVTRGELVVVYCMLFLAVPVLGASFWHQFPGLQLENVRTRQLTRVMSVSPHLWPNAGNLLEGASVEDERVDGIEWALRVHPGSTGRLSVTDSPDGLGQCVSIEHDGTEDISSITLRLDKSAAPRFVHPLTRYAVSAQVRLDDPGPKPSVKLMAGAGPDTMKELRSIGTGTEPSYIGTATKPMILAPMRFIISGQSNYQTPRELEDHFFVELRFAGRGSLYARDFAIVETEQAHRYFEGYPEVSPQVYGSLPPAERGTVRVMPRGTLARWYHRLIGRTPWSIWSHTLAVWSLLIVGSFLAMLCLVTLFFRQWNDHDRLTFPLQTFVLDLTRGDEAGRLAILKSGPFWIGIGLSVVYLSLQQLHLIWPVVPAMDLTLRVKEVMPIGTLRDALPYEFIINIRPAFVAVAFLMSLEISQSLVVFFLLGMVWRVVGFFTPLKGIHPGHNRYGGFSDFPFENQLIIGGLLFLGCHCVFSARRHLVSVARRVCRGPVAADDEAEVRGYRWAAVGLITAAAMMFWFSLLAQVHPGFVAVYLGVMFMLALSAARIRAETGLPHLQLLVSHPQLILVALGGALVFGFRQTSFLFQTVFLYAGSFLMLMPVMAESMAASVRTGVPLGKLMRCLVIAFVLAMLFGGVVFMSWNYTVGASNLNKMIANTSTQDGIDYNLRRDEENILDYFREHPDEPRLLTPQRRGDIAVVLWLALVNVVVGFVVTALLALGRVIWLGFPLHPLGFVLAYSSAMEALWASIAVGHLVKRVGLQFGGVQLSRNVLRPFFVGLFVGDLFMVACWRVIAATVVPVG